MKHRQKLSLHFFDFHHFTSSQPKTFKLRLSLLSGPIPEHRLIRGSQPLAGYAPKEFRLTEPVTSNNLTRPNQVYAFDLCCDYEPLRHVYDVSIDDTVDKARDKGDLTIVVELLMKCSKDSVLAKNYYVDGDGFANVGHNMLVLRDLGKEVHQVVQVVFDEVVFCSAGLVFHVQSSGINFSKKKKAKSSRFSFLLLY